MAIQYEPSSNYLFWVYVSIWRFSRGRKRNDMGAFRIRFWMLIVFFFWEFFCPLYIIETTNNASIVISIKACFLELTLAAPIPPLV